MNVVSPKFEKSRAIPQHNQNSSTQSKFLINFLLAGYIYKHVRETYKHVRKPKQMTQSNLSHRPSNWETYIGQDDTKELLQMYISGSNLFKTPLGHSLFLGPSGMGKTTLALIVANILGVGFHEMMATEIKSNNDILAVIKKLKENDVLFIDEIHMLSNDIQTYMYKLMESEASFCEWDADLQSNVNRPVPKFTLIGATTHHGNLLTAFLSRFVHKFQLQPYTLEELEMMAFNSGQRKYGVSLNSDVLRHLARLSHGTARALNNLVDKVVLAGASFGGLVTKELLDRVLRLEAIDNMIGMDYSVRQYIVALSSQGGKAVGLKTLCNLCNQEPATIESVIEPILIGDIEMFTFQDGKMGEPQCGPLMESTSKGRVPTSLAGDYIRYCKALQAQGWFRGEKLG